MNLFQIMWTSIKAKINPILTKVKLWLTPSYIKNRLLVQIRTFFLKLFNVRPSDESDYYSCFGWLVSKRLAFAIAVVVCVAGGCFLINVIPSGGHTDSPYKTYKYNSIPLKMVNGKVQILGKSGYVAYVGDFADGQVKGTGTLYDPKGNLVYVGEFDVNAYNGEGTTYYSNDIKQYEGHFRDNLYEGEGKLYRENGTLEYEGEFSQGSRSGNGTLYNSAGEPIYTGNFNKDKVLYQELLGKNTEQVSQMYTGKWNIYESDAAYCVSLHDIHAVYYAQNNGTSLEDTLTVQSVYVLEAGVMLNGSWCTTIPDIRTALGAPIYEGNTYLTEQDQISLNVLCEEFGKDALYGKAELTQSEVFDEVTTITAFDREYQAYIYVFETDDVIYTFFCKDKDTTFDFYMIEMK